MLREKAHTDRPCGSAAEIAGHLRSARFEVERILSWPPYEFEYPGERVHVFATNDQKHAISRRDK